MLGGDRRAGVHGASRCRRAVGKPAVAVRGRGRRGCACGATGAATRGRFALGGSDDPALDLLLRAVGDAVSVVPGPRGSVNGIVQLARGAADAATVHLLDVASGRWNDPIARGALGGAPVELVHLWRREQGLVVARGNPHGIAGVADLDGRRIAWRPPGTGSRLLLERLMLAAGCVSASGAGRAGGIAPGGRGRSRDRRGRCRPGGARGRRVGGPRLGAGDERAVRAGARSSREGRRPSRCWRRSPSRACRHGSRRCRATTSR